MRILKKRVVAFARGSLLSLALVGTAFAAPTEPHVTDIERRVLTTRQALLAHGGDNGAPLAESDCIFVSF